ALFPSEFNQCPPPIRRPPTPIMDFFSPPTTPARAPPLSHPYRLLHTPHRYEGRAPSARKQFQKFFLKTVLSEKNKFF
ncbi:hypothetical protein CEXT_810211, partial [Caerostris extrusa]